jgi:RNA polymerase sigma factor (sigma-70 family)
MNADEQRLEQLAEAHSSRVLAYLTRRTVNSADAVDVFQAVLETTWRRLRDVPVDDQAALAWLLGTARRCLANQRRGQTRRLQANERLVASIRVPEPYDFKDSFVEVRQAIHHLGEGDRELLTLVYWDDLTVEQAAKVLGVAPSTARKRLERARTRVRLNLEAAGTGTNDESAEFHRHLVNGRPTRRSC